MSEPTGGTPPTFDPKDKAHITDVRRRGDWYTVQGVANGRKVSVDIMAKDVHARSRPEAEALMRRSILGVSNTEKP